MMNPDFYEFFVVSEESIGDPDSRISNVIAGGTKVDLTPDDAVVGGAQISSPWLIDSIPRFFFFLHVEIYTVKVLK